MNPLIRFLGVAVLASILLKVLAGRSGYLSQPEVQARMLAKGTWQKVQVLLWIPLFLGSMFGIAFAFIAMHKRAFPNELARPQNGFGMGLVFFAALFMAIPISMLLANALMWLIPSARKAMQQAAGATPDIDFTSSNTQLLLGPTSPAMSQTTPNWARGPIGCAMILGGIVVAFVGALVPWGK